MRGLTIEPAQPESGCVIRPTQELKLDVLDRIELFRLLASAGYVVLRGFDASVDRFAALVHNLCSRTMLDRPASSPRAGPCRRWTSVPTRSDCTSNTARTR